MNADFAVDDENLAVRAVVDFFDRIPGRRIEFGDVATRLAQPVEVLLLHRAGADRIDDEVDQHTAPRRALERVGELVRDFTGIVDVGLEADSTTGGVDGLEHRGENLVAVGQDVEVVAARRVGAHERRHVCGVRRVLGRHGAADPQGHLVLREHQAEGDDRRRDERG